MFCQPGQGEISATVTYLLAVCLEGIASRRILKVLRDLVGGTVHEDKYVTINILCRSEHSKKDYRFNPPCSPVQTVVTFTLDRSALNGPSRDQNTLKS
jgi:hypothetical protein